MTETIHPIYVILGATGGIGTALCRRLARNGARLFIAGRSQDRLVSLAKEVDAQTLVFDATDGAQVSACVDQAMQTETPFPKVTFIRSVSSCTEE